MNRIDPGGTIGIFGGGQLGRMTALAAARLGYRCHVFCPEAESPAVEVSAAATIADYGDLAALDAFSAAIDVARTQTRTAERRVIELRNEGMLPNTQIMIYLNRLSDLLFMLARYEDRRLPMEIVTGQPPEKAE